MVPVYAAFDWLERGRKRPALTRRTTGCETSPRRCRARSICRSWRRSRLRAPARPARGASHAPGLSSPLTGPSGTLCLFLRVSSARARNPVHLRLSRADLVLMRRFSVGLLIESLAAPAATCHLRRNDHWPPGVAAGRLVMPAVALRERSHCATPGAPQGATRCASVRRPPFVCAVTLAMLVPLLALLVDAPWWLGFSWPQIVALMWPSYLWGLAIQLSPCIALRRLCRDRQSGSHNLRRHAVVANEGSQ